MNKKFYRAFEDKYRGSSELIKSRLLVYLPFVKPLHSLYNNAKAIDLGCGRGEWLELLQESDIDGYGVDLDDEMLSTCRGLGLSVANVDALAALKSLPDESQLVVSGFHIAEHLPFSDLQSLVQEALRVLKPAGLLILETPNPENIAVGTVNFYLDPTHQRPIPPQLLSFLPEYFGFAKVKVIRLQEDKALFGQASTSLHDVLCGVSPDYAVIAQKSADMHLLSMTNDAFVQEYGLTLDVLAGKFDLQMSQAVDRAAQAESKAQQAIDRAAQAESKAQQAIDRAAQAETAAIAVFGSRSWRVTAPIRWLAIQMRLLQKNGLIRRVKALIKKIAEPAVRRSMVYLDTRPVLRSRCLGLARKTGLYNHLRSFFFGYSLPSPPLVARHEGGLASLRMMREVDLAIKNTDSTISVIYLEME